MIDIERERVISLAEAARRCPSGQPGKKVHASTVYRWWARGLRGVHLETIRCGGVRCTSVEALQRFFAHLDGAEPPPRESRRSAIRAAARECDAAGI